MSYSGTAYGWTLEDKHSFCNALADRTARQLLGAHIIGPEANLLIQPLILGMEMGLTVDDKAKSKVDIHAALTEVIENALLNITYRPTNGRALVHPLSPQPLKADHPQTMTDRDTITCAPARSDCRALDRGRP